MEMPLKIRKAAMTLTQMISRSEKKGPFASMTIEMSALLGSEIRAGHTSYHLTENDSQNRTILIMTYGSHLTRIIKILKKTLIWTNFILYT